MLFRRDAYVAYAEHMQNVCALVFVNVMVSTFKFSEICEHCKIKWTEKFNGIDQELPLLF